jgi:hypothetical protein
MATADYKINNNQWNFWKNSINCKSINR